MTINSCWKHVFQNAEACLEQFNEEMQILRQAGEEFGRVDIEDQLNPAIEDEILEVVLDEQLPLSDADDLCPIAKLKNETKSSSSLKSQESLKVLEYSQKFFDNADLLDQYEDKAIKPAQRSLIKERSERPKQKKT